MPAILENINWIDIFFIILLLGMLYKGLRVGVGGQIFSLIGAFVLVFVSLGYYKFLSEAIFGFMLQRWSKPISFFVIMTVIFTVVKVLEKLFNFVASGEELSTIERIGGAIVAIIRSVLVFGIIGSMFILAPVDYIRQSALEGSRSCLSLVKLDAQIYSWMTEFIQISGKKEKDDILNEILSSSDPEKKKK